MFPNLPDNCFCNIRLSFGLTVITIILLTGGILECCNNNMADVSKHEGDTCEDGKVHNDPAKEKSPEVPMETSSPQSGEFKECVANKQIGDSKEEPEEKTGAEEPMEENSHEEVLQNGNSEKIITDGGTKENITPSTQQCESGESGEKDGQENCQENCSMDDKPCKGEDDAQPPAEGQEEESDKKDEKDSNLENENAQAGGAPMTEGQPDSGQSENSNSIVEKGAMAKTDSQAMAACDKGDDDDILIVDSYNEATQPKTLKEHGYHFVDGEMKHIETNEGFVFKVQEHISYNQKRYEAIGELITEYVYDLLESQCHLKRTYVPIDATEDDARGFIFMSEDAMTNTDKLLLLIHGSGVVRAGQWARRLIMNENLDKGTQIPYIEKAMADGYGVIVLNTNQNYVKKDGEEVKIKKNSSPEKHAKYVWDNFVLKAAAKHVAIVAHSYGGVVATDLALSADEFLKRVFAIAFTDSVHSLSFQDAPSEVIKFYQKRVVNWVASDEPLDTEMKHQHRKDAKRLSAGHPKHEWTSSACIESVFKFFTDKYSEALNPEADDDDKGF